MLDKILDFLGLCRLDTLNATKLQLICFQNIANDKEKKLTKLHNSLAETKKDLDRVIDETIKDKEKLENMEQELLELRRSREDVLKDIHKDLVKTVEEQSTELKALIHERIGLDGKVQQIEVAAAKGKDIVYLSTVNVALNDFKELMLENVDEVLVK